jgi:hypothetical protein
MSYAMLEKQLQSLPEEYYDEVSQYIEYLLFRQSRESRKNSSSVNNSFFGSIKTLPDGMAIQEAMRDEWS